MHCTHEYENEILYTSKKYDLKAYAIKSVLPEHAQMVFNFLACLVHEKN
jgi:hypothetical protein